MIEVQPLDSHEELDRALDTLPEYGWVVFGSANAVEAVFDRLASMGRDARSFHGVRVAAMGSATAASLESRGIVADLVVDGGRPEGQRGGWREGASSGRRNSAGHAIRGSPGCGRDS